MVRFLIRSIHRYASDGFLLLVLLHGLKTLLSDRYWGSRWLAWVSGWVMVVSSWFIGTTGYWLVWDQRAQWLTEYLINNVGGGVALTFLAQDIDSSTFIIFVIILFVHVFLPIILLGLFIVHILRLIRARIWSPR
ncbi:MAG: cytochrome b N-terminal domain-containing protein, partial [Anaerolineae bacterium]|nr:cytochrome b N-terminal domain-containing protein [Anaerolineae bacterium]